MSDKSKITYLLREAGSEDTDGINILTTGCTKVPEVGEVININTKIDREELLIRFREVTGESLQDWLRKDEAQIKGDFVVVSVKRWFNVSHSPSTPYSLPSTLKSSNTSVNYRSFPVEHTIENFEVMVEPFRHTELTETPIAKLRNKMSPIYGYFQLLKAIRDKEIDFEAAGELFTKLERQAIDSVDDVVDFIKDKKIWK